MAINSTPVTVRGTGVREGLYLELSPENQPVTLNLDNNFRFRVILHNPGVKNSSDIATITILRSVFMSILGLAYPSMIM